MLGNFSIVKEKQNIKVHIEKIDNFLVKITKSKFVSIILGHR